MKKMSILEWMEYVDFCQWAGSIEGFQEDLLKVRSPKVIFFFFAFLGQHLRHMEVPRPRVQLELQLPTYTTATVMRDPNHVCDLHCSSQQRRILNPLNEATSSWVLLGFAAAEPQQDLSFF